MTIQHDVELLLRAHYEERADRTVPDGQLVAILDRTARRRQRPGWLAALRSPSMTATALARPAIPRAVWLLATVGLIGAALLAAYLIAGALKSDQPVNGQIVIRRDDAASGDKVILVVNPDGSHERELTRVPFEGAYWSPDGRQIGLGNALINANGTDYQAWDTKSNPFNVACIDWSPDGRRMLCEGFSDDVEADQQIHGIYTVRASDGKDVVRLSPPGQGGVPGSYSPDGTMVAYIETLEGVTGTIMLVRIDGTDLHQLGTFGDAVDPRWAPDGKSVLFNSHGGLYSVDVATGVRTQLTINGQSNANLWAGTWSPDGTRILFNMTVDNGRDLFTMLADGTDLVRVTNNGGDVGYFDWGTHPIVR